MLEKLKDQVCGANLQLNAEGLVIRTWGNVSGIDRESGHVVIKPSGVSYDRMKARDMVVVSLDSGESVEGSLRPSSDTPTHLELYRAFPEVGGIAHTHSLHATAWAQAKRDLPLLGTTHADYFHGAVPCTRVMRDEEVRNDYEANTGRVIVERFATLKPMEISAVLVAEHGPFTWGADADAAVDHAAILEHLARLATLTTTVEPYPKPLHTELMDRHFCRKHGPDAYYGQSGPS
jgi:L-ribulose-5-phosphate 4-epimerase